MIFSRKATTAGLSAARQPWRQCRVLAACFLLACVSTGAAATPATFMTHQVREKETLMDIARHHAMGFVELRAANPAIDPWIPGEGRTIVLPSLHLEPRTEPGTRGRHRIVVNLGDMRLYLYRGSQAPVLSFPIGIGRDGWETPTGETRVVLKRRDPTWVPPASIRARNPRLPAAVPPGPSNPLGSFALNLGWPGYVIHGTNKPDGVGRRVSHGCLRLYPEDIEHLFTLVEVGMPVTIVDQPIKLGWIGERLYLEIHPDQQQSLEVELLGRFSPRPMPDLRWMIESVVDGRGVEIDWALVERVAAERRGLAIQISR